VNTTHLAASEKALEIALGGRQQVPPDWMPASQVRPFIFDDPAVVWLQFHGDKYGFEPDTSPYEFLDFIAEKSRQFEQKWIQEMAPEAVQVCRTAQDVHSAAKVRETFEWMQQRTPVIAQPALWWAPERIYGVPDLLVHTSWLRENFAHLWTEEGSQGVAQHPRSGDHLGHYVVIELKFTTKLDRSYKGKDLDNYAAQVRIYTYMLGQLQGRMPKRAYLVARDRVDDPLPVGISSELDRPLDEDVAAMRDQFVEIRVNGAKYVPWEGVIVALNLAHRDDRWRTAKEIIARERVPGGDAALMYQIGTKAKRELASRGYPNLTTILQADPEQIPLEEFRGIGAKRAARMRAILKANKSGAPVLPPASLMPPRKPFEFYVDLEFFTNLNVNFETQWPTLDGCEMVFMIGVGWEDQGDWRFKAFVAERESQDEELAIYERCLDYLKAKTNGALLDGSKVALYHWTRADPQQTRSAGDRHQLAPDHPLRKLPWFDLQGVFLDGPAAIPGAWAFGLKEVAKALGTLDSRFDTEWPGELDVGLRAMVMGWRAYEAADPARAKEMHTLREYLEADCKALWQILRWLRTGSR
jgi:hypothetical protein